MKSLSKSRAALLVAMLLGFISVLGNSASAEESVVTPEAKAQMGEATKSLVANFQKVTKVLENRPASIDASRWTDVQQGAKQLADSVDQLNQVLDGVQNVFGQTGDGVGQVRARLAQLKTEFMDLHKEARADIDGRVQKQALPEELLEPTRREAESWQRAAGLCDQLSTTVSRTFGDQQARLDAVIRTKPMLVRIKRGATAFGEMAKVGKEVGETRRALESFGAKLNVVLDMVGKLADSTEAAIAEMESAGGQTEKAVAGGVNVNNQTDRNLRFKLISWLDGAGQSHSEQGDGFWNVSAGKQIRLVNRDGQAIQAAGVQFLVSDDAGQPFKEGTARATATDGQTPTVKITIVP